MGQDASTNLQRDGFTMSTLDSPRDDPVFLLNDNKCHEEDNGYCVFDPHSRTWVCLDVFFYTLLPNGFCQSFRSSATFLRILPVICVPKCRQCPLL